jgi:hypothetical protein
MAQLRCRRVRQNKAERDSVLRLILFFCEGSHDLPPIGCKDLANQQLNRPLQFPVSGNQPADS